MNYLVLDTETSGLGKNARMCSICWNVYDKTEKVLKSVRYLVKPDKDFVMTEGAQKVHNISVEMMEKDGREIVYILKKLKKAIKKVKCVVGHNLVFDEGVINYECERNNIEKIFDNVKKACTMLIGNDLLKLNKWPKLSELYRLIFNKSIDINKLHSADYDVNICAEIFFALRKINKLK